jgi:hypothetical protein
MTEEDKVDYLEVDDTLPGQNYVCLSFVSPESLIESKESFKVAKFLQSVCKDKGMDVNKTMEQYKDFTYKFQDDLQKDFDERNDFKTNIRGLKVRGTYNTRDEADRRAAKLQKTDSDFHVFVGQVGYWLPWDPCADKIEDESFLDSQLNDMMGKYKENSINKDVFYEEQKRDKVKTAREEVIRKKKEKEEEDSLKKIEDPEPEVSTENVNNVLDDVLGDVSDKLDDINSSVSETVEAVEEAVEAVEGAVEAVKEAVEAVEGAVEAVEEAVEAVVSTAEEAVEYAESITGKGETVDEDLKKSLTDVDPWLANKENEKKE